MRSKNIKMKLIITVMIIVSSDHFSMNYYDCEKSLGHYSAKTICQQDQIQEQQTTEYLLLQKERHEMAQGYSCQEIESIFFLKCGVWSHTKMFQAPIIERIRSVQTSLCNTWISSGKYSQAGKTDDLSVPGETIIASNEIGILNLNANGNVKCAGQQVKIGNSISNDVVELI